MAGQFIHIFVNQGQWLIKFLEHVSENIEASPIISNNLLELYLREENDDATSKEERREKAIALLRKPEAQFDTAHALVLCQMYDFKQGQLQLFERMSLFHEIVQYHMDNNEYDNIIKACKKYAKNDANLWVKALTYFANKDPSHNCKQEILEVLRNVETNNLLPPLQVIKLLSQSSPAYLGLVKSYVTKYIIKEKKEISKNVAELRKLQEEIKKNKEEIKELKSGPKLFQIQKCTRCQLALDLPAVHFLCNHSFHQRCLSDLEGECPNCLEENRAFRNRLRDMDTNAKKHSEFFGQLEKATEGFSVVAKYFGFGLFNKTPSIDADVGLPKLDPNLFKDLKL